MNRHTAELAERLTGEAEKIILGKRTQIRLILTAVLAGGHILLDDLPGVGKTTLVKTLATALGCGFRRIQFTPDLLPSDITGMNIYNQKTGEFQLMQGPVMTNLLLADEINRAIPRTQSALLEAMEERQVTIDGVTYPLPRPFLVMATQNPVEMESTFHLPAAQMDRFMLRLTLGYPEAEEEKLMLERLGDRVPMESVETVTAPEQLWELQAKVGETELAPAVADYIVSLVRATRAHPLVRMGGSPRSSIALFKCAKAYAAIEGQDFVTPDHVQLLAPWCLCHRMVLSNEARFARATAEGILQEILETVPVPPTKEERF
ncbi:MAG: MoxR family ATPase [Bacillota bacterium]|nr:MoxR family ATPase [Bacillota bacterium]